MFINEEAKQVSNEIVSANRHIEEQAKKFEQDLRALELTAKLAI